MTCYTPIPVVYQQGNITFLTRENKIDANMHLPCSRCIGCKLDRCSCWALRCTHEAKLYKSNYFITLTFEKSPVSCDVKYFQKFMKKLRRWCEKNNKPSPRYFHATEYGSKKLRPHHHAILFNIEFNDLELWKWKKNGNHLYISKTMNELWGHGFTTIGAVTHDSIAYTAAYTIAKDSKILTTVDGEILNNEQMTCSRAPAIGLGYIKQNLNLVQHAVENAFMYNEKSKKQLIPRAYQKWLKEYFPDSLDQIKMLQEARAYERSLVNPITEDKLERNLRSTKLKMKKHKRALDIDLKPITLEQIKQFRLNTFKGIHHEIVHN